MRTYARLGMISCLLSLVGCVDDNVSVFVTGNLAPTIEDTGCSYDPASTALILQGTLDVGGARNYVVHPRVTNQLQRRGAIGRGETNGVFINRAEVTLTNQEGALIDLGGLPNPFSVPLTVYVPAAASADAPGVGTGVLELIPPDYAVSLPIPPGGSTLLLASVRLVGQTQGEIDIETGEWLYPINVCNGCLLACGGDPEEIMTCSPGMDFPYIDAAACVP